MYIFKNFIVVFIITGVVTRLINFYFKKKKFKREIYSYISFFIALIVITPITSLTIGFDVTVAIYFFSLIVWLIFDNIRANAQKG